MAQISIHKLRCAACPYYEIHSEPVARKVKGRFSRWDAAIAPVERRLGYSSVLIQRSTFLRGVRAVRSRLRCAFIAIKIPTHGS